MRFFFLLLSFLSVNFSMSGQNVETSPFGFEVITQLSIPEITGGNTESEERTGYVIAGVLVYGKSFGDRLSLESGLQLGADMVRQRTIERLSDGSILRRVSGEAHFFQVGVPLFVKWSPLGQNGPYLKGGGRFLFNFSGSTKGELDEPDLVGNQEATLFPAGEVDIRSTHPTLEGGIGYNFFAGNGRFSYVELSYGKVLGDAITYAGERSQFNRLNYLDTARLSSVKLTFGFRFGR